MKPNQQVLKHLLRFCVYNEDNILTTNDFYTADHKVRLRGEYRTLKAWYFYYKYGVFPHGKLIDPTKENRIVDCEHLIYQRNGV